MHNFACRAAVLPIYLFFFSFHNNMAEIPKQILHIFEENGRELVILATSPPCLNQHQPIVGCRYILTKKKERKKMKDMHTGFAKCLKVTRDLRMSPSEQNMQICNSYSGIRANLELIIANMLPSFSGRFRSISFPDASYSYFV